MKKVFIDCGGHIGSAIDGFKDTDLYDDDFVIYSFEPVDHLSKNYKDREDIIFSNKAIWTYDGFIDFFVDETNETAKGSSLVKEKTSGKLNKDRPIKVPCIDFGKWLTDNFDKDDLIVVKMDIEGAEYQVLWKMIIDESISFINRLYIEFHYKKINMDKTEHDILLKALENISGLELLDAMFGDSGK